MFFFFSFSDLFFNKGRLILVKKYNNSSFEKTNTHKHLGLFNRRGGVRIEFGGYEGTR
jgi:hypothetical protein